MRRALLNAFIWTLALGSLGVAGLIAAVFALMAISLDPIDAMQAGLALWTDALHAALTFLGVVLTTVVALLLWHSRRFRVFGAALAVAEAIFVVWVSVQLYFEYV